MLNVSRRPAFAGSRVNSAFRHHVLAGLLTLERVPRIAQESTADELPDLEAIPAEMRK